jgi:hypothetical protein
MGRVVDIERVRVEQLAVELLPALRDRGELHIGPSEVESIERWRRAACAAARELGEPIRTGRTRSGGAWAVLIRPVTYADQRRAAETIESVLRGAEPSRHPTRGE